MRKQNNPTKMKTQTLAQHIAELREKFNLHRTQLFTEGREVILQGVKLKNGAKGCTWTAQRGDSLHDALNEAAELLAA